MKIIESNFERRYAKVVIENVIDLWCIMNILEAGDFITAKTTRTIFLERVKGREKVERRVMTLTIQVEKMEMQEGTNKLRITGKILEGPEEVQIGSYHTIEVKVGSMLYIEKKEWKKEQIDRLERARTRVETIGKPTIINEFFIHLDKEDGLAVYGFEQVRNAALMGAVKIILIPMERIKERGIDELIKEVESRRGKVKFVLRKEPLGEKFCRTYDVGAILRFRIS